jgi:hypothetical protein
VSLDGTGRDVEFVGDLLLGISLVVLEAENDPAFFREGIYFQLEFFLEFVVVQLMKGRFIDGGQPMSNFPFESRGPGVPGQSVEHFEFGGDGEIIVKTFVKVKGGPASPETCKNVLNDLFGFRPVIKSMTGNHIYFIPISLIEEFEDGFSVCSQKFRQLSV